MGDQRLQDITNATGSTTLSKFDYTYNPVGTIATWKQQTGTSTPTQYGLSYDAADQLTDAEQTNTSTGTTVTSNKYGYDPAGNRLTQTTTTGTTTGNFNNLNQLMGLTGTSTLQTVAGYTSGTITGATVNAVPASISNSTNFSANVPLVPGSTNMISVVATPSGTTTGTTTTQRWSVVTTGTVTPTHLAYDANGNTTTDESGNTYAWDALNRLTKITYPSGASSLFAYDGLSRRVQIIEKNSSGTVTSTKNYLWLGSEIVEERNSSNAVQKRFFPQGEQQSGTNYYYTRDHLGSVREMLNSSGTIVARYSYDPYGRTTLVSGSNLATKQFTGDYYHATSGLNLTWARAYNPNTGRWFGRDPLGEQQGDNLYSYSDDDPSNEIDPLGLRPKGRTVDPTQTDDDFYMLNNLSNFHRWGYWGGPHVTSGSFQWAEAENFPNDKNDSRFKPPYDARDTCYYRHDVCLHNAGTIKEPGIRHAARAACDHNLAGCLCAANKDPNSSHADQDEINRFAGKDALGASPNDNEGEYYPDAKVYPYLY